MSNYQIAFRPEDLQNLVNSAAGGDCLAIVITLDGENGTVARGSVKARAVGRAGIQTSSTASIDGCPYPPECIPGMMPHLTEDEANAACELHLSNALSAL
ncbi:MAG: hypothetical protein JWP27_843 [Flaviaesturariibacter sp.]|nr:hypothetical protein [Flaviaesturariibacter sp.]